MPAGATDSLHGNARRDGGEEGDSRGPGLHADMNPRRPDHMSYVDPGGIGPNFVIFI